MSDVEWDYKRDIRFAVDSLLERGHSPAEVAEFLESLIREILAREPE